MWLLNESSRIWIASEAMLLGRGFGEVFTVSDSATFGNVQATPSLSNLSIHSLATYQESAHWVYLILDFPVSS